MTRQKKKRGKQEKDGSYLVHFSFLSLSLSPSTRNKFSMKTERVIRTEIRANHRRQKKILSIEIESASNWPKQEMSHGHPFMLLNPNVHILELIIPSVQTKGFPKRVKCSINLYERLETILTMQCAKHRRNF
jgi:hypothetical protein